MMSTFLCIACLSDFPLHRMPMGAVPSATHCNHIQSHNTAWDSFLSAQPLVICDGHSKIMCAMRAPPTTGAKPTRKGKWGGQTSTGFFCWIRHAYHSPSASEWHAFCNPTPHWSGTQDDRVFLNAFTRGHNHFHPDAMPPHNVPQYMRVHRLAQLPDGLPSMLPPETGEAHFLLHGDSVTSPRFNPWHANADLLNFFITSRMLSKQSIGGDEGRGFAANMSVFPVAGCNGMGPGRGNWDVWSVITPGKVHMPLALLSPAEPRATRRRSSVLWSPVVEDMEQLSKTWVRVAAVVLSPHAWASPVWSVQSAMRQCPHVSSVLVDFRNFVTARLDPSIPGIGAVLRLIKRTHGSSVQLLHAPLRTDGTRGQARSLEAPPRPHRSSTSKRRLVYLVRRSKPNRGVSTTHKCHRCLWNIDALAAALAEALPDALVVLANPGNLSFAGQYALFRAADLLVGVHGSAFAWGVFLTPTQSVLELPLPGSPGLNDWLFAAMGAHTAVEQACLPRASSPSVHGCSQDGGDADVPLVLRSVSDLLLEENNTQPVVWQQLGRRRERDLVPSGVVRNLVPSGSTLHGLRPLPSRSPKALAKAKRNTQSVTQNTVKRYWPFGRMR